MLKRHETVSGPKPGPGTRRTSDFQGDAARWRAVVERNASADGCFLYGVTTTGVVCRPQCASRLPRRGNVRFFDTLEEALRAGFRACKRCRPDGAAPEAALSAKMAAACRLLDDADGRRSLREVAAAVGLSPYHFLRVFKTCVGVTPAKYAAQRRMERLVDGLGGRGKARNNVADAIYGAGYGSSSRVYERAGERLGMSPGQLREGGAGTRIRYDCRGTVLGVALIAATTRGVCALLLGADEERLEADLKARFGNAILQRNASGVGRYFRILEGYLRDPARPLRMALDPRGSAFQQRVWRALREIAPGSTLSYAELACACGYDARHARAVAAACASNAVAVAIPCHRVVRGDGSLAGYRWGTERKAALLALERGSG